MRAICALTALLAMAALTVTAPAQARALLTYRMLMSGHFDATVPLRAFTPDKGATAPTNRFEGSLTLSYAGTLPSTVVLSNALFVDAADIAAARTWPADFSYDFVQSGADLIPVRRGAIRSSHAWWEPILEPGKVWNEGGDHGFTRAALPFSLQEKNANCTHNGVLMFLFRSDGRVSRTAMQITGETCLYLKLDLWGLLATTYTPASVADKSRVIAAFGAEISARMPTRTLADLHARYPQLDLTKLEIGAASARTLYGVVVNGVNYVSACETRNGDYPYCDELDLPSFSTAKSVFAGLTLMHLQQLHPGVKDELVRDHVPECAQPSWDGVSLEQTLDMATGNYDSDGYTEDELAAKTNGLFLPLDHHSKIAYSCGAYPRRAAPGTKWVYHTSDTYILGTALTHYFRSLPARDDGATQVRGAAQDSGTSQRASDIFSDVLVKDIFEPLHLSPGTHVTRRTYDAVAQPFTGWGLTYHRDDVAKLGKFLAADRGAIDGTPLLDAAMFDAAMQRVPSARGLQTAQLANFRYQHGFWARNLQSELGCRHETWVPFLSGFGGISVVLFPNGVVYYNFAEDGLLASYDWGAPAREINRISDFCP
jgi:hypothetical protein